MLVNFEDLHVGYWVYFEHTYVEYSYGEITKIDPISKLITVNDAHYEYTVKIEAILQYKK